MRRDLASAYLAGGMRLGGWVVISAIVYRRLGAEAFALLALIRATTGLLNYLGLGLPQALVHYLPKIIPLAEREEPPTAGRALDYERLWRPSPQITHYATVLAIFVFISLIGSLGVAFYGLAFNELHVVPPAFRDQTFWLVCLMGVGLLVRLLGENGGAVLQTHGLIWLDNLLLASNELLWVILSGILLLFWGSRENGLLLIGIAYFLSNVVVGTARDELARRRLQWRRSVRLKINLPILSKLLAFGGMVVLAQLADYLYAPTDYILINRLLHPADLANYVPAIQIDAGLMLLVTALGAVLLPKSALAHAAGDVKSLKRYYRRGTLGSLALLIPAAAVIWTVSPWIFRLWLGNPMPGTQVILPLVLVHSILGGSSAAGRGLLIGMGQVRAFSVAVLVSGVVNVALSFILVRYAGMGLEGIVVATIVAVVLRCALWMPWYVLRTLRRADRAAFNSVQAA